jgi:DNA-directed RNA polymerase subunit N
MGRCDMIIPIRCFTCGKVIADKWEEFSSRVKSGESPSKVLNELGIERYCCRRMFITHVDIIDEILKYPEAAAKKSVV